MNIHFMIKWVRCTHENIYSNKSFDTCLINIKIFIKQEKGEPALEMTLSSMIPQNGLAWIFGRVYKLYKTL